MNSSSSPTPRNTTLIWRNFNLRTKLIIILLLASLVPLIIISLISDANQTTALTNDANAKLLSAADVVTTRIDVFMQENLNVIRAEGRAPAVVDYVSLPESQRAGSPEEARMNAFLLSMARQNPVYINSVAILDAKGITLADTLAGRVGADRSDRYYFQNVLATQRPYASTLEYDEVTKRPSLYFAAPIRDRNGNLIGVLRKRFDAAILQDFIISETGLAGEGSFAVLIDENFVRIAHGTNRDNLAKSIVPIDPATLVDLQTGRFMPSGTSEELSTNIPEFKAGLDNYKTNPFFAADLNGQGDLEQVAVAKPSTQPWLVAFAQPQENFLAPINAQRTTNILIALVIAAAVAAFGVFVSQTISGPVTRLTQVAESIAGGNINIQAKVETGDEIGTLAGTFNRMTQQLRDFITTLESRVAERTRNLELAGEVGRTVSQVRALEVMLTDAAELIRKQFDLYYVQVYLVNPSQTYLNLQAGTGDVGKQLLERKHRLAFNTNSINGRAAVEKKSVVISDTTQSPTFRPNPLLPDTRSEMAVPLLVGDRVVGVLDMQSTVGGALGQDVLTAFEALAGQLAIAIQNANFLADVEQSRAEVQAQAARLARTNYTEYLDAIHKPEETGFAFEQNTVTSLANTQGIQPSENALVVPISVTGLELGKLVVEMEGQSPIARTDDLLNTVARQVAQQVENLRLLESAERYRAEAEEASRRLTREGWKAYEEQTESSLSYLYDLNEVRPSNGDTPKEDVTTIQLKVRDEVIGKLAIQGMDNGDTESVDLANAVAERLSTHIESLRQFDETRRNQIELNKRATELQAVAEISTQASIATNMQEMLQNMVDLTKEKFNLYHTHIYLLSDDGSQLVLTAGAGDVGRQMAGEDRRISIEQQHSLVARAARSGQGVISNDVTKEPDFLPNPLLPETRSEMAVPIMIGDQLLGVFDVQGNVINRFTDEDIAIKTTLSRQIAVALQNLRNFAKAQQQAERESKLNVISQKIQSATTVEAVLQIAARELGHALGAPMTIAQLSMKDKS
jgi:GAF domain-containing protein/HAMP domain-containing protein